MSNSDESVKRGRIVRVFGIPMVVGRDDPGRSFWLTHLFLWIWYLNVVVVLLLGIARVRPVGQAFFWGAVEATVGLLTVVLLRQAYRRWLPSTAVADGGSAPFMLLACIAGGVYWAFVAWGFDTLAPDIGLQSAAVQFSPLVSVPRLQAAGPVVRVVLDTLVLVLWSIGYLATEARRDAARERTRALEATAQLQTARFEALRYQVNPHFLFNALTSLQSLVVEDATRAQRMVGQLATYLRYTLLPGAADSGAAAATMIPLRDELAATRAYLAVEHARFDDALRVDWRIETAAEAFLIPPLLLQPLVENAIRHGWTTGTPMLALRISAALVAGTLQIEVANTGTLRSRADSRGIGLANVSARLTHAFPGRHTLQLTQADGWVLATLRIAPA